MKDKIGIILNGATGRICSNQHLANSLVAIRDEEGLKIANQTIVPELLLVGRNEEKLKKIARVNKIESWTTDLELALADPAYTVFFDAAATEARFETLKRAIKANKHIYTEKPVAPSVADGLTVIRAIENKGLKHGAVEDKIHAPGFRKMANLVKKRFFGRIVGFKLDFGWWVFDGITAPATRTSWNYQRSSGGGMIFDMVPHWRYVVETLMGPIRRLVASSWTAQSQRADEEGSKFDVDVEDSCSIIIELENGAFGTITSSWAQRVPGNDLVRLQIDGTLGSAENGLRTCRAQSLSDTPSISGFNLGAYSDNSDTQMDYNNDWTEVPETGQYKNPYRVGWEQFLSHVIADTPMISDYTAGIRDVQLAEACIKSAETGRWIEMGPTR